MLAYQPTPIPPSSNLPRYEPQAALPPYKKAPPIVTMHLESPSIVPRLFSRVQLNRFVRALDCEDSTPPPLTRSGVDVLQLHLSNPNLTASLPFNDEANAYGPVSVKFLASDSAGNEAASVTLAVYISSPAAAVGTAFALAFTVSDLSFPPATSEALLLIVVVSPCEPDLPDLQLLPLATSYFTKLQSC
jgi:hypothetical protein